MDTSFLFFLHFPRRKSRIVCLALVKCKPPGAVTQRTCGTCGCTESQQNAVPCLSPVACCALVSAGMPQRTCWLLAEWRYDTGMQWVAPHHPVVWLLQFLHSRSLGATSRQPSSRPRALYAMSRESDAQGVCLSTRCLHVRAVQKTQAAPVPLEIKTSSASFGIGGGMSEVWEEQQIIFGECHVVAIPDTGKSQLPAGWGTVSVSDER